MKNQEARSSIATGINRPYADTAGQDSWLACRLESIFSKFRHNDNTTTFAEKLNNKAIRQQIASRLEDLEEYGLLSGIEIAERKARLQRNCVN